MSVVVDRVAEAMTGWPLTETGAEDAESWRSNARAALLELAKMLDESWGAYADATNLPAWDASHRCSDGCLPCFRQWLQEVAAP